MTSYRSESRGFVYTAPPSGDEENRTRPKFEERDEDEASETADASEVASEDATAEEADERTSPTLGSTTATTDANWTGTVPADD